MKQFILFITGMILFVAASANTDITETELKKEAGIEFHQGSWSEALKKAQQEKKPVFLDVYATWYGPCKMLKARTFPNEEVGEFYNANFINVAVDGEKGEGLELARKYKVRGYPTLLYIDSEGKVIAQTAGYRNPKQFIQIGEQVINR
ncbi:MAG TPA: thioredoxin family protein [Mariniphaga anaerophila]|uniref:Thioredoxin family protein n=1 Tax=Mariniphaga anaerophila TaxID=1484053 RepID=A0A831PKL4_9BACT|nr:thioredoxin family protein [Mariniphaga anaerophila]